MNRRKWLISGAILLAVAALIAVSVTTAYLTDVETADNVITIGRVKVSLIEGAPFDDPDPENPTEPTALPVVPGSRVTKAPKLENTGNKDEYVFIKLTVPKAEVTLLQEDNEHIKGTKRTEKSLQELFRLIAYESITVNDAETELPTARIPEPEDPSPNYDVDIAYHCAAASDATGMEHKRTIPVYSVRVNVNAIAYCVGFEHRTGHRNRTPLTGRKQF